MSKRRKSKPSAVSSRRTTKRRPAGAARAAGGRAASDPLVQAVKGLADRLEQIARALGDGAAAKAQRPASASAAPAARATRAEPPPLPARLPRLAPGRAFRLADARLVPMRLDHIRTVDHLYGYDDVKSFFGAYYDAFANGQTVPPLLLSGLPGLGKTHFAIAYTAARPALTLVVADERVLVNGLEQLIERLGHYADRRFVLFFDDVNAEALDWTTFRHQVGGILPMPGNVALVLASNYSFPGAIRSRCTNYDFRPMDVAMARELIAGYFQREMEIAEPRPALLDVIAADFVEQYTNGPLDDLTPRSLIRYFDDLSRDEPRRTVLMNESLAEMVRQPDEDAFIRSNKRVIEQMQRSGGWEPVRKVEPTE